MIVETRQQEPFIHFGFNKQSITVATGEDVTIWQDKIYIDSYDNAFTSVGATLKLETINKVVVTYGTVGSYTFRYNISDKDKTFTKVSNLLTVNVVPIIFGNTGIRWNNTEITFND